MESAFPVVDKIPPHSRCTWMHECVLIGAVPIDETFDCLNNVIDVFVDLEGYGDYARKHNLPSERYINFPIRQGGVPSKKNALQLLDQLLVLIKKGKTILCHCRGGFGRTTVIGALLCWSLYNMNGTRAIEFLEHLKTQRIDKSRNFVPCPETQVQAKFICNISGGTPPDRSDRSWLIKKRKSNNNNSFNKKAKTVRS